MFYRMSKTFFVLFLFYIGWFQTFVFPIPRMPLILGGSMIILLVLHKMLSEKNTRFIISKPIFILLFFILYSLLSGFFVVYDKNHFINSLFTYVQIVAMMIYIVNISTIDKNNNFFIKCYVIFSIFYMLCMMLWGFEGREGRLALSENSNPNGDGLTLLFGVFCILFLTKPKKIGKLIVSLVLVSLHIYIIVETGSRKSFIGVILLVLFWFSFAFKDYWKAYSISKKLIFLLVLLILLVVLVPKFSYIFLDSSVYHRLIKRGYTISSDQIRSGMYRESLAFFYANPLFGIGFNHYRILSIYGTYSHSTYAELISTTGIIGTIIYLLSYVVIIYNLIVIYIKNAKSKISLQSLQYMILMFIMLVLGTGVIHFYRITDNIMFALMISFYQIEKSKLNKQAI